MGLSDRGAQELKDRGREDLQPAVDEAVRGVAASHAGRPIDEVEAVLAEAVTDATHVRPLLSEASLEEIARQISASAKHAWGTS